MDDFGSMILVAKRKVIEKPEPELGPSKVKAKHKKISIRIAFINEIEFVKEIKDDEKIQHEQIFKDFFFFTKVHYF